MALVMADTVACAAATADDAELKAWAGSPQQVQCPQRYGGEATVLGTSLRLPRDAAARANATQANWWQLDEGHHEVMCHAGLYCVPAGLAESEAEGMPLDDLVLAVAVGYEVTCRVASAYRMDADAPHPHALWSGVGAAATLAAARRFSPHEFMAALDLAGACMPDSAPFALVLQGALVANTWAGMGVEAGFACAASARELPQAPVGALHESLTCRGAKLNPAALKSGLGEQWAVQRNYHKLMACGGQSHAAIEALLQARLALKGCGAGHPLAHVQAQVHAFAAGMSEREPSTSLAARFSIPHLLAVAWIHGRTDAQALGALYLHDSAVGNLRRRVVLQERVAAPPPNHRAACVTVSLPDGTSAHGLCLAAPGSAGNPVPARTIAAKCREMGGNLAGGKHAGLLEALLKFPPSASVWTQE